VLILKLSMHVFTQLCINVCISWYQKKSVHFMAQKKNFMVD